MITFRIFEPFGEKVILVCKQDGIYTDVIVYEK